MKNTAILGSLHCALSLLLVACGASPPPPSTTAASDGTTSEAGVVDSAAAASDASPEARSDIAGLDVPPETTPTIASNSTAWGKVNGECGGGWLAAALADPKPSFHVSTYAFAGSGAFDAKPLRPMATKRRNGPNNGGSSNCSEAMSIQTICDCEGAKPLKTEVEIAWTSKGQTTDWLGELAGKKFGVSVSRIYLGPTTTTYTAADAKKLLEKKLGGINESSKLVAANDQWVKQVLHLWTLRPEWVPTVQQTWQGLDAALKADTVVLVTVEQGSEHIVKETCK